MQSNISKIDDSTTVSLRHIVAANQAFTEVIYWRRIVGLLQEAEHSRNAELQFYKKKSTKLQNALDTLEKVVVPALERKDTLHEHLYLDFKYKYNTERSHKIGLAVSLPVVAILSFIVGFFLAK